jgi:hypothetical protein
VQEDEDIFQYPPNSISWLFDEPCMVVGIDVGIFGFIIIIFLINLFYTEYSKI